MGISKPINNDRKYTPELDMLDLFSAWMSLGLPNLFLQIEGT